MIILIECEVLQKEHYVNPLTFFTYLSTYPTVATICY